MRQWKVWAALALAGLVAVAAEGPTPAPRYRFVAEPGKSVVQYRAGRLWPGNLTPEGDFIWHESIPSEPLGAPNEATSGSSGFTILRGVYNVPLGSLGRRSPALTERVLEYRSGRLVPGLLDSEGHFVPDLGGAVTDFAKHVFTPQAPRIYNLPGHYVDTRTGENLDLPIEGGFG